MSDAVWPVGLPPAPQVQDLVETFPQTAIRTAMEAGRGKTRQRYSVGVRKITGSLKLTRNQVALFDQFFRLTLLGGTLSFEWKHPRTGEPAEFRFLDEPQVRPLAPRQSGNEYWTASLNLELFDLPITQPPGVTCIPLYGSAGTPVFGSDSTIGIVLNSACRGASAFYNEATNSLTLTFARTNLDESGQVESIDWEYTADGQTSTITYHRDTGWSMDIAPLHSAPVSCGSDTEVVPSEGYESQYPYFTNKAEADYDTPIAGKLCATSLLAWMKTADATVNSPTCGDLALRHTGFRAYAAICTLPGGGA